MATWLCWMGSDACVCHMIHDFLQPGILFFGGYFHSKRRTERASLRFIFCVFFAAIDEHPDRQVHQHTFDTTHTRLSWILLRTCCVWARRTYVRTLSVGMSLNGQQYLRVMYGTLSIGRPVLPSCSLKIFHSFDTSLATDRYYTRMMLIVERDACACQPRSCRVLATVSRHFTDIQPL